jgi:hypothetical protein
MNEMNTMFPYQILGMVDKDKYRIVYHPVKCIDKERLKGVTRIEFEEILKKLVYREKETGEKGICIILDCTDLDLPTSFLLKSFGIWYLESMMECFEESLRIIVYNLQPWMIPFFLSQVNASLKKCIVFGNTTDTTHFEKWVYWSEIMSEVKVDFKS